MPSLDFCGCKSFTSKRFEGVRLARETDPYQLLSSVTFLELFRIQELAPTNFDVRAYIHSSKATARRDERSTNERNKATKKRVARKQQRELCKLSYSQRLTFLIQYSSSLLIVSPFSFSREITQTRATPQTYRWE